MAKKNMARKICINPNCRKCCEYRLSDLLIKPFEGGTTDTQKLFSYFLHSSPVIESIHSKKIPDSKHDELFDLMMKERHFYYQQFCSSNAPIEKELKKVHLNGDEICFKCKRYVCKRKKTQRTHPKESNLECFLRHIRNSIAHGYVFFYHAGNKIQIMFEDRNSSKKVSARIICIKADLEHWKRILSRPDNYL